MKKWKRGRICITEKGGGKKWDGKGLKRLVKEKESEEIMEKWKEGRQGKSKRRE